MTAKKFYEQEHGSHQFLSRATIIQLMEDFASHLQQQKPDDDSHLRQRPEGYSKKQHLEIHFNRQF